MEWLNYHHLRYFWAVVRDGGVTRASEKLNVSQPTVSAQLRELEEALGEPLFERRGRTLELTEMGRVVHRYADEIFAIGQELVDTVRKRPTGRPSRLAVGVADAVPKLIAHRLLAPALAGPEAVVLSCFEDRSERLLSELATHGLDVVIADAPVPPSVRVKAFTHLLGECGVAVFATPQRAAELSPAFPGSLDGAPFLLPTQHSSLRRGLDAFFEREGLRPRVMGEFEDLALLKTFGQTGLGVFAAPVAISREVERQYSVQRIGDLPGVRERYYAITVERRLRHPAVLRISQAAREQFFAP